MKTRTYLYALIATLIVSFAAFQLYAAFLAYSISEAYLFAAILAFTGSTIFSLIFYQKKRHAHL